MDNQDRRAAFVNWPVLYREMDKYGLDAIVATSPESTFYLAGCHLHSQLFIRERLAVVVVPRNGSETYIVDNIEHALAKSVSWVDDVRPYIQYVESPIAALAAVVGEKGLSRGKIGFEEKFGSATFYWRLEKELPQANLVAADAAIGHTRAIKMPAEIDILREAACLSDEAVYAAWQSCPPGTTEHEVAVAMTQQMLSRGAQSVDHISLGSGPNTHIIRNRPGNKRLEPGDLFFSDFGVVHKKFWADLCRMGVVGQPSARQRDLYRLLRDVQRAAIAGMKPGTLCKETFAFARAEYAKAGIEEILPHIGHSMPRSRGHEPPVLQPHDSTPLEPNMVFAVEPSFRAGRERYHIEDLVLVTESEPQILSDWWDTEELFVFQ